MKFHFATWPEVTYQGVALTAMDADTRLISYYYLRNAPQDTLERYVRDGFIMTREMEDLVDILSPTSK
jgi:hypothetical protein